VAKSEMGPRWSAVGSALVVCVAAAGCGSSASKTTSRALTRTTPPTTSSSTKTAASQRNFDSCSVVTQADASSALGQSVSPGALGNATVEGGKACVFYGPSAPSPHDPNVPQTDTVRVVIVKGPRAAAYYRDYKSKVSPRPISGYGDHAFYDGFASLSVLKGDVYLRVAVVPAGAPPSLTDEEKLATAVLPGL
jgi:hypothetical protein